jgi:hypothetical protein
VDKLNSGTSCKHKCGFFCSHSCRDIKRHKCNFCLAFCSVFVVVLSTLIINTIVSIGPIIFLRLSETKNGQIDAILTPTGETEDFDFTSYHNDYGKYMNFTKQNEINGDTYNLAPRKLWCNSNVSSASSYSYYQGCLMLMDTALEKAMSLGVTYPFNSLEQNQCVVSERFKAQLNVEIGDKMTVLVYMTIMMDTMVQEYNVVARE